ncbi:unnamed protein product, partial [Urochloa humidicola]
IHSALPRLPLPFLRSTLLPLCPAAVLRHPILLLSGRLHSDELPSRDAHLATPSHLLVKPAAYYHPPPPNPLTLSIRHTPVPNPSSCSTSLIHYCDGGGGAHGGTIPRNRVTNRPSTTSREGEPHTAAATAPLLASWAAADCQ